MRRNSGETFTVDHRRIEGQLETYGSDIDRNVNPSGGLSSKDKNVCATGRIEGFDNINPQKNRDIASRLLLFAIGFLYVVNQITPSLNMDDRCSSLNLSITPVNTFSFSGPSNCMYSSRFSLLSVEKSNILSRTSSAVTVLCSFSIANSYDRKAVDKNGSQNPNGRLTPFSLINGFSIQTFFTPKRGITRLSCLFGGHCLCSDKTKILTSTQFAILRNHNETLL